MDSHNFFKDFIIKEDKSTVLNASYVIASSRIRLGNRYMDQVESIYENVFPDVDVLDAYDDGWDAYKEAYFNMLRAPKMILFNTKHFELYNYIIHGFFKIEIFSVDDEDYISDMHTIGTVVLITHKENKHFKILELLKEFMWEELDTEVFIYPDLKRRYDIDIHRYIMNPFQYVHEYKVSIIKNSFSTRDGRISFFKSFIKRDYNGARKYVIKHLSKVTDFSKYELKRKTLSELTLLAANNLLDWSLFFDWTFYDPYEYDDDAD